MRSATLLIIMNLPIPYWIGLLFTLRENETAYSLLFTHNNADFGAIHSVTDRSCTTPISKVKRHISSCELRYSDRSEVNREFKIRRLRTTTTDKHATAHDQNHVTVHFSRVVLRLR